MFVSRISCFYYTVIKLIVNLAVVKYGAIHYYEDADIENWCPELTITQTRGIRTFWDMQQNQEIHKDAGWQEKMIEIEMRVSDKKEYQDIAFFHHLILAKTN